MYYLVFKQPYYDYYCPKLKGSILHIPHPYATKNFV